MADNDNDIPVEEELEADVGEQADTEPDANADDDVALLEAEAREAAEYHRKRRLQNMVLRGDLVLHYDTRDVIVTMDGDAAIRLLTMFRRRSEGTLGDALYEYSSASNGWLVLDITQPLAVTWIPAAPGAYTAIDPVMPSAA